jgi:hypothetical protein
MAVVDYERAWMALKVQIAGKASHGKRDLQSAMAEIEIASMVPEGQEQFDPRPPVRRAAGSGQVKEGNGATPTCGAAER